MIYADDNRLCWRTHYTPLLFKLNIWPITRGIDGKFQFNYAEEDVICKVNL